MGMQWGLMPINLGLTTINCMLHYALDFRNMFKVTPFYKYYYSKLLLSLNLLVKLMLGSGMVHQKTQFLCYYRMPPNWATCIKSTHHIILCLQVS